VQRPSLRASEAIHPFFVWRHGLLRRKCFSRNDGPSVARRAIAYGFSMSRPCERRDPYAADFSFLHSRQSLLSLLRPG